MRTSYIVGIFGSMFVLNVRHTCWTFFLSLLFLARYILRVTYVYRGLRVRGFIPSVLDWEEGLIVSYPLYIITDRMFTRPGSYRLWVSVIRVVSPVNVATVSAHLNMNSCLEGGEDEKKLMSIWYNMYMYTHVPIAVGRFSPIVFPPPLYTYYFIIICTGRRRRRCRQCLRETLILKSLLLYIVCGNFVCWLITRLSSSSYLYYYHYSRVLYLYTAEHRCTHCLSCTLDYLSLKSTRHFITGLIYYISYLLLVCCVDSCDALIMHLSSQLHADR